MPPMHFRPIVAFEIEAMEVAATDSAVRMIAKLRSSRSLPAMSELGPFQTSGLVRAKSVHPSGADMR
jgi:hypothetical protein